MTQEALKLALELLESAHVATDLVWKRHDAVTAIKEALAHCPDCGQLLGDAGHIHTCSPLRLWVGLTDEDISKISQRLGIDHDDSWTDLKQAIEAKLKEKNT